MERLKKAALPAPAVPSGKQQGLYPTTPIFNTHPDLQRVANLAERQTDFLYEGKDGFGRFDRRKSLRVQQTYPFLRMAWVMIQGRLLLGARLPANNLEVVDADGRRPDPSAVTSRC